MLWKSGWTPARKLPRVKVSQNTGGDVSHFDPTADVTFYVLFWRCLTSLTNIVVSNHQYQFETFQIIQKLRKEIFTFASVGNNNENISSHLLYYVRICFIQNYTAAIQLSQGKQLSKRQKLISVRPW